MYPIGSWLLSYAKVVDEELGMETMREIECWDSKHDEESAEVQKECECFKEVRELG